MRFLQPFPSADSDSESRFYPSPFLNVLSCFCFFKTNSLLLGEGGEACGILAPRPGIEPAPPALEGEVLTTGLPGKSLVNSSEAEGTRQRFLGRAALGLGFDVRIGIYFCVSLVAQMVKNLLAMQETQGRSLGREGPLEKEMATHSSILVWRIPWTEVPGRLQSTGLQRDGHS